MKYIPILLITYSLFLNTIAFGLEDVSKGKELYLAHGCAVCHGESGRGDGINARNSDPAPTNFSSVKNYHRGHEKQDIVYSVRNGIAQEGSIMPAYTHIPRSEIEAMADYLLSLQQKTAQDIVIKDAWVEAMPPIQKMTAGFMTIENTTDKDAALVSVSTDIAQVSEIHEMSRANGMMKMAMLKKLSIPAKGKAVLGPGGYHLMLINLTRPVNKGDTVVLTLNFDNGQKIEVSAQVRPAAE